MRLQIRGFVLASCTKSVTDWHGVRVLHVKECQRLGSKCTIRAMCDFAAVKSRATTSGILAVVIAVVVRPRALRPVPSARATKNCGHLESVQLTAVRWTASSSAAPSRPNYGYSVIRGGAWDAQELRRAVKRDPVVADHYRDLDPTTMRAERLTSGPARLCVVSRRRSCLLDEAQGAASAVARPSSPTARSKFVRAAAIAFRWSRCCRPPRTNQTNRSLTRWKPTGHYSVSWSWGPTGLPLAVSAPPGDPDDMPVVGPSPFGSRVSFRHLDIPRRTGHRYTERHPSWKLAAGWRSRFAAARSIDAAAAHHRPPPSGAVPACRRRLA